MNKPQLFCFTYAGGRAAFFDRLREDLPGADVQAPEYPGHGERHREPLLTDLSALADDQFRLFRAAYSGGSYALLGYSMGSVTLVEVLRRILENGYPAPVCVFPAAHMPYTDPELAGEDVPDEVLRERTIAFGAVPEQLLQNKSFWRMYLPLFRADYTLLGRYRFDRRPFPPQIPAVVFYSETDTPLDGMRGWQALFPGCRFAAFTGQHFFICGCHRQMAEQIWNAMNDAPGRCMQ